MLIVMCLQIHSEKQSTRSYMNVPGHCLDFKAEIITVLPAIIAKTWACIGDRKNLQGVYIHFNQF